MTEALDLLQRRTAIERLRAVTPTRRSDTVMVQATITAAHDLAFAELRLDVCDALGDNIRFEQLWSLALELWAEQAVQAN
jgi:hypothetical protein